MVIAAGIKRLPFSGFVAAIEAASILESLWKAKELCFMKMHVSCDNSSCISVLNDGEEANPSQELLLMILD